MLIFTIPKAFEGIYEEIQNKAIESWLKITNNIVLFGDENGVAEAANRYDIQHIKDVEKNNFGTPLLSYVFSYVYSLDDIKCYINTDIIISGLDKAIEKIKHLKRFLVVGRRMDWINNELHLHTPDAVDYFLYRGILVDDMPPFAVGRCFWDDWIVAQYLYIEQIPVIDGSKVITAIHQEHPICGWDRINGEEAKINKRLTKGRYAFPTDARLILTEKGLEPRTN